MIEMRWLGSRPVRLLLQLVLLVALFWGAAATRRHVLNAQRQLTSDGSIPFTLESALAFRRIQMMYRDGELPKHDRGIQYPEGVAARETDTLGAERYYAETSRRWPGVLNLAEKIRWLHLLWFCLAVPGIYFWVKWMGGGALGGFWAAAFYAVAISVVARSTGQELSHENNALPLLVWHLAADARRGRSRSRGGRFAAGLAAAVMAALALCLWDLVQYYLALTLAWELFRAVRGRLPREDLWSRVVPLVAVLLVAGLRNPYLRAHGFAFSPVMGLGWGAVLAGAPIAQRQKRATRLILGLTPLALALVCSRMTLPAYGHFAGLFWAKLRHLNIRPANPARLTFEQRILWVPALHSTSLVQMLQWFPALLGLTAAAVWGVMRSDVCRRRVAPGFFPLLLYGVVSLGAFVLFFRFHVWLALFACGLLGLGAGCLGVPETRGWRRYTGLVLLTGGLLVEASQPWRGPLAVGKRPTVETPEAVKWDGPLAWGRPNVYATETEELMNYLLTHVAPEPVLANFGVSASIAAYGGCPVVLHPKFESPDIRAKVRDYGEALFLGDESEFRSWMESQGATVYVYSKGEFSTVQPGYQMRYMVNALDPATNAAARLFEQRPKELEHFAPQFDNRKYCVYRLTRSPVVARLAQSCVEEARTALAKGNLAVAEWQAAHALRMDPDNEEAQTIVRVATNLREDGFREEDLEAMFFPGASPLAPADPW